MKTDQLFTVCFLYKVRLYFYLQSHIKYSLQNGSEMAELYEKMNKNWYAIYTRSRWEKKVDSLLVKKGIESWCPLQKKERKWSDRYKVIDEPIFRSYLFVQIEPHEILNVLQTEGVLFFIGRQNKPFAIRQDEMLAIRRYLLAEYKAVTVYPENEFFKEQPVLIAKGVFMDERGSVVQVKQNKVIIRIESLDRVMVVEFAKEFLEPLPFSRS